MTSSTIEHWRDGECVEKWMVTEEMIQRDGDTAKIIFPIGRIVLASYDELHFCIDDTLRVLGEVQHRP